MDLKMSKNSYSYTFLIFQIWTILSFSLLLVQNHHKNTLDLQCSGTWHVKSKGCPNLWPHNHVRQNTSMNQPKTRKPQHNMLVFGGRREFSVVSILLKNVWDQFQVSKMCSVTTSLKLYYKNCTSEGRLTLNWKTLVTEPTFFQKHYPEEAARSMGCELHTMVHTASRYCTSSVLFWCFKIKQNQTDCL
jgi:hypothetical protein